MKVARPTHQLVFRCESWPFQRPGLPGTLRLTPLHSSSNPRPLLDRTIYADSGSLSRGFSGISHPITSTPALPTSSTYPRSSGIKRKRRYSPLATSAVSIPDVGASEPTSKYPRKSDLRSNAGSSDSRRQAHQIPDGARPPVKTVRRDRLSIPQPRMRPYGQPQSTQQQPARKPDNGAGSGRAFGQSGGFDGGHRSEGGRSPLADAVRKTPSTLRHASPSSLPRSLKPEFTHRSSPTIPDIFLSGRKAQMQQAQQALQGQSDLSLGMSPVKTERAINNSSKDSKVSSRGAFLGSKTDDLPALEPQFQEQDLNRSHLLAGLADMSNLNVSVSITTGNPASSYWSVPEQKKFPSLIAYFGRDYEAISNFMETKTATMVKISDCFGELYR
jgi:hypothetical protein